MTYPRRIALGSPIQEEGRSWRRKGQEQEYVVVGKGQGAIIYNLVTPSVASKRLKERSSLAKAELKELQAKGLFVHHHEHVMYTGTTKEADVIVE
uniref:Uncharacterized protein n=1 Tax=Caenorhabditis japonica TaxID=281687 RepID=A0A8R1IT17_CAEJA